MRYKQILSSMQIHQYFYNQKNHDFDTSVPPPTTLQPYHIALYGLRSPPLQTYPTLLSLVCIDSLSLVRHPWVVHACLGGEKKRRKNIYHFRGPQMQLKPPATLSVEKEVEVFWHTLHLTINWYVGLSSKNLIQSQILYGFFKSYQY